MAAHILVRDSLTAGGGNSELRSILEVLEGLTRLHIEFS